MDESFQSPSLLLLFKDGTVKFIAKALSDNKISTHPANQDIENG